METPITVQVNKKLKRRFKLHLQIVLAMLGLTILAGCGTTGQLERIAKDWCMTIRASQVMPAYPLTEDLQPGDVFLVQRTKQEEIDEYKEKGFLPLENHIVRLSPEDIDYHKFYSGRYGIKDGSTTPPGHWQYFDVNDPTKTNYAMAPWSAFPSYSFSVSHSVGFNMAVPVYGVPVGLNLLNSSQGYGSVTISSSNTYGNDIHELEILTRKWAMDKNNAEYLARFEPYTVNNELKVHYLRVVHRVYLANKVEVSVFSGDQLGVAVSGGVPKPVNLLNFTDSTPEKYNETLKSINDNLATDNSPTPLAGGSLKVTAASSRAISLSETFPRPLVFGFLAFDLPILKGGGLGAPVLTQSRLTDKKVLAAQDFSERIRVWLRKDIQNRPNTVRQWLNTPETKKWLKDNNYTRVISGDAGITNIIHGAIYGPLRVKIIEHFDIP